MNKQTNLGLRRLSYTKFILKKKKIETEWKWKV